MREKEGGGGERCVLCSPCSAISCDVGIMKSSLELSPSRCGTPGARRFFSGFAHARDSAAYEDRGAMTHRERMGFDEATFLRTGLINGNRAARSEKHIFFADVDCPYYFSRPYHPVRWPLRISFVSLKRFAFIVNKIR